MKKKKTTQQNSQEPLFNLGDLVAAKVKGYPFWPGTIEHVEELPKNRRKYTVRFFKSNDTSTQFQRLKFFNQMTENDLANKKKGLQEAIALCRQQINSIGLNRKKKDFKPISGSRSVDNQKGDRPDRLVAIKLGSGVKSRIKRNKEDDQEDDREESEEAVDDNDEDKHDDEDDNKVEQKEGKEDEGEYVIDVVKKECMDDDEEEGMDVDKEEGIDAVKKEVIDDKEEVIDDDEREDINVDKEDIDDDKVYVKEEHVTSPQINSTTPPNTHIDEEPPCRSPLVQPGLTNGLEDAQSKYTTSDLKTKQRRANSIFSTVGEENVMQSTTDRATIIAKIERKLQAKLDEKETRKQKKKYQKLGEKASQKYPIIETKLLELSSVFVKLSEAGAQVNADKWNNTVQKYNALLPILEKYIKTYFMTEHSNSYRERKECRATLERLVETMKRAKKEELLSQKLRAEIKKMLRDMRKNQVLKDFINGSINNVENSKNAMTERNAVEL